MVTEFLLILLPTSVIFGFFLIVLAIRDRRKEPSESMPTCGGTDCACCKKSKEEFPHSDS